MNDNLWCKHHLQETEYISNITSILSNQNLHTMSAIELGYINATVKTLHLWAVHLEGYSEQGMFSTSHNERLQE